MKWLIGFSRKRNEKSMAQRLAGEIIAASKEEGAALRKKKILTEWLRQIKHSLILDFKRYYKMARKRFKIYKKYWDYGPC